MEIDERLILGALTAASRALAIEAGDDPDVWDFRYTSTAARACGAFMLTLGSPDLSTLLNQIADATALDSDEPADAA